MWYKLVIPSGALFIMFNHGVQHYICIFSTPLPLHRSLHDINKKKKESKFVRVRLSLMVILYVYVDNHPSPRTRSQLYSTTFFFFSLSLIPILLQTCQRAWCGRGMRTTSRKGTTPISTTPSRRTWGTRGLGWTSSWSTPAQASSPPPSVAWTGKRRQNTPSLSSLRMEEALGVRSWERNIYFCYFFIFFVWGLVASRIFFTRIYDLHFTFLYCYGVAYVVFLQSHTHFLRVHSPNHVLQHLQMERPRQVMRFITS